VCVCVHVCVCVCMCVCVCVCVYEQIVIVKHTKTIKLLINNNKIHLLAREYVYVYVREGVSI